MPKFKLNERVRFKPNMGYFSPAPTLGGSVADCGEVIIVGIKGCTYKIRGYTGFWPESFFEKLEA